MPRLPGAEYWEETRWEIFMRKTNVMLSAAFCVATIGWAGSAAAFNPQPDPPGRHLPTTNSSQLEPPDPCVNAHQVVEYKDGEDGVNRTRPGNHKPGKMACMRRGPNSGAHMLNPQPLPPG
jgi:hypothetical protein